MLARYLAWRTRRAGPPVALGVKAARYGAVAVLLAVAILVVPVMQGYRDGVAERGGIAPDGGHAVARPAATEGWAALREMGRAIALGDDE